MKQAVTDTGKHAEMPYERFVRSGPESLSDAELLAIILRTGTKNCSAVELGRQILTGKDPDAEPSLSVLFELTREDLLKIHGVGEVKAVKILCLAELSKRLASEPAKKRIIFSQPDTVYEAYRERLRHEKREHFFLLLLDIRLALISEVEMSVGTSTCAPVSVRDIFSRAVRAEASGILLLHNHPSGDPTPSANDIETTRQIAEAGRFMQIPLIDHIIIGDSFCSLRSMGILDEGRSFPVPLPEPAVAANTEVPV